MQAPVDRPGRTINKPPAPPGFYEDLGTFHAVWQSLDVVIDFAIGHFLNLKVEKTFAETEGRPFGAKLGKLKNLIAKSDHPDKAALLFLISQLFESNRNEITHSYLDTELDEVKFVYMGNSKSGLKARTLAFKGRLFAHHVTEFVDCANRFQNLLRFDIRELDAFAERAARTSAEEAAAAEGPLLP